VGPAALRLFRIHGPAASRPHLCAPRTKRGYAMQIVRARTAGFCMGVSLALQTLDKALLSYTEEQSPVPDGRRIITYGPIIHNPQVLEEYEARGVLCTERLNDIRTGDAVIIRAHGIPRQAESALLERGAILRDATCPKVKKAQLAIRKATQTGQVLLLYGEEDHPEVKGLVSYAAGEVHVFDSFGELLKQTLRPEASYVLAAQTTQDLTEFERIAAWVEEHFPQTPVLHTICDATRMRQDEALSIASQVEAMVVVGGKTSGNTRRLAQLAEERGVKTWHVEMPEELPGDILSHARIIGLTAGASTPRSQIDETQQFLESLG